MFQPPKMPHVRNKTQGESQILKVHAINHIGPAKLYTHTAASTQKTEPPVASPPSEHAGFRLRRFPTLRDGRMPRRWKPETSRITEPRASESAPWKAQQPWTEASKSRPCSFSDFLLVSFRACDPRPARVGWRASALWRGGNGEKHGKGEGGRLDVSRKGGGNAETAMVHVTHRLEMGKSKLGQVEK